jgi:L-amino acid N-acyltransferase YncA
MKLTFASMTAADWPAVQRIYQEGIDSGHATFESTAPATWDDFAKNKLLGCCLIARNAAGEVVGWISLAPVSTRPVYVGVAEVSFYVDRAHRRRGVGDALLGELIRVAEDRGIWTLQSATFPENAASIALQQKHGFRIIGRRERIGRMSHGPWAGRWRDTVLMERRSQVAGLE